MFLQTYNKQAGESGLEPPGVTLDICSDPERFTDGRRAQTSLLNFWDSKCGFSSAGLQQRSAVLTSIAGCLYSLMLTAGWNWRGNVLYFMKVITSQTGEGERRQISGVSGEQVSEFTESCPEFNQHKHPHTLSVCRCSLMLAYG